jgi:hypothetical protein
MATRVTGLSPRDLGISPGTHRRDIPVLVTDHARRRARDRFDGFKGARIVDEVRDALVAGRLSSEKPVGLAPPDDPSCLYVWTADGARVYALRHDVDPPRFVVTTTMRTE